MLLGELALVEWTNDNDNVQNFWDSFESKLVTVVDKLVIEFKNNRAITKPPPFIKNKINKRNRLLKLRKSNCTEIIKRKIIHLNAEIKSFYFFKKIDSVCKGILPGNSRSLWSAVKISKDTGTNDIPQNMSCDGVFVACNNIPQNLIINVTSLSNISYCINCE